MAEFYDGLKVYERYGMGVLNTNGIAGVGGANTTTSTAVSAATVATHTHNTDYTVTLTNAITGEVIWTGNDIEPLTTVTTTLTPQNAHEHFFMPYTGTITGEVTFVGTPFIETLTGTITTANNRVYDARDYYGVWIDDTDFPPAYMREPERFNTIQRIELEDEIMNNTMSRGMLIAGGRQSGKTTLLVKKAMSYQGNILIIAPNYNMADYIFDLILKETTNIYKPRILKLDRRKRNFQTTTANIRVRTAKQDDIRGIAADYVLIDELPYISDDDLRRLKDIIYVSNQVLVRQIIATTTKKDDKRLKELLWTFKEYTL